MRDILRREMPAMATTAVARAHCLPFTITTDSPSSKLVGWSRGWLTGAQHPHRFLSFRSLTVVSAISTPPFEAEPVEEDILQDFFKDRELYGDFITRASNKVFWRQAIKFGDKVQAIPRQPFEQTSDDETEGGFLKITTTQEWLMGESSPPANKKLTANEIRDDQERRKKLNFLNYEALKKELLLLTAGIGAACCGYCLIAFSLQASLSYATGVAFSCLYLQLLYQHSDNISSHSVPQIFTKKKTKKIGIRSEDLKDVIERSVRGSGIALSSPRLVIPGAVFGLWVISHQIVNDLLDFQVVPAMLGLFAYKAAALVQVYRDNRDLQFLFPEDDGGSLK